MQRRSFTALVVLAILLPAPAGQAQFATLKGHKNTITCLAFANDGKLLATGGKDGTAILWDLSTHEALATLPGQKDMVTAVAFSPDSKRLATVSHDSVVRIWTVPDGKERGSLRGHDKD